MTSLPSFDNEVHFSNIKTRYRYIIQITLQEFCYILLLLSLKCKRVKDQNIFK